jgi:pimeloyl-ACP methyl ester carboxylesterase/acyl-CoA thioesterase FadM
MTGPEVIWHQLPEVYTHGERIDLHAAGDPTGEPVLLLHGLEDGWATWGRVIPHLAPGYRYIAADLPWRTNHSYRWRSRAPQQWIADVINALPRRPAAVIAHSFSANALLLGLDGTGTPELAADTMVLISPFYRPPHVPLSWDTFERSRADFRATMTEGLRIRLGERAGRLEPDVFDLMAKAMLDGIGILGFLAVFEQFAATCELDLSAYPGRALVIAGSRDPGIAGERIDHLRRAVPQAEMDVDPDYSHFCHLDQPELIGPLVADFLTKGNPPVPILDGSSGPHPGRPRFEGANISTFIGFKNFTALAEDVVLQHLRELGHGPQHLFERYGLGTTIVHSSMRLTATMHSDDQVVGTVTPVAAKPGQGAAFDVKLSTRRGDAEEDVRLANGRVRVQLISEKDGNPVEPVPAELTPFVVAEVTGAGAAEPVVIGDATDVAAVLAERSGNSFLWAWKIPYFACHYYTRNQHQTYVKLLEEAVDRYLEHVGLPITGLLAERDWIPVVSRSRVDLHADAFMGEELLITFAVDDVIKDSLFTARMECHVLRGDRLVHIASATIMHGYVLARGENAFSDLVVLDAPTQAALLGGRA